MNSTDGLLAQSTGLRWVGWGVKWKNLYDTPASHLLSLLGTVEVFTTTPLQQPQEKTGRNILSYGFTEQPSHLVILGGHLRAPYRFNHLTADSPVPPCWNEGLSKGGGSASPHEGESTFLLNWTFGLSPDGIRRLPLIHWTLIGTAWPGSYVF